MSDTEALTGKLLDIINQVQGAVSTHSGEAVNLVLTSTRIDGISWLLGSFIFLCLSVLIGYSIIKYDKDNELIPIALGCLVLFLFTFANLVYPWNWIQVFNPKLYLAHEIIGKVLN
jgi:phosphotransferase system  glucose/maltose/N-acetylglucosamine-specific IIC component